MTTQRLPDNTHRFPRLFTLAHRAGRKLRLWFRVLTGFSQPSAELGQAADHYWNAFGETESSARAQEAHWRGHGVFADDTVWLKLGREHRELLHGVLHTHGLTLEPRRVVEWGCGGGMNAVHFAPGAHVYYGVDIAQASLQECARQLAHEGFEGFVPVLVDANHPRRALQAIGEPCDLFTCTYVFELLPSEAHAFELLELAHELLRPGGVALIHIRCRNGGLSARSRPWDYAANMAYNVTFTRPAFHAACTSRGFKVLGVIEKPAVPELNEKDYAYFVLQR